jgi:mercuric ion binding protein
MNSFKKVFYLIILFSLVVACNSKQVKKVSEPIENTEVAQNLKNVEVAIEGMTCEIGCARLIESKLSKTDGVTFVQVSFEDKFGNITFDENKISNEKIKETIQKIAGGETYKVTDIQEVINFRPFTKDSISEIY